MQLDDLFAQAEFTPNDPQRAAISHVDGPLFLVAGPGSGKTRVLLWRTLNLVVFHGVAPERILLSTFTEKAAKQLRDGLVSLLASVTQRTGRPFDLSGMYVGTVHSLCNRMLTDRALAPGRSRVDAPTIDDPLDQYFHLASGAFWREAVAELAFVGEPAALRESVSAHFEDRPSPSRHKAVMNLAALFNRFSEENLQPETLLENLPAAERPLAQLYALYRRRLGTGRVDLALLQQAALETLERLASGPAPNVPFDHVIVDEFQDTNAIQESIFFRLAEGVSNVCVVGDDDQALYRFRGATVSNFVRFPDRCRDRLGHDVRRIALNVNYRSRRGIVDFYSRFIEQEDWTRAGGGHFRLHDKGITAHSDDAGVSVVASAPAGSADVAAEIADLVKRLLETGRVDDPNQIAFLFPSLKSRAVETQTRALEAVGLKVYAPRAKRFLEADEPSAIVGLIGLVLGRPSRSPEHDFGSFRDFHGWLDECHKLARDNVIVDPRLKDFLWDRRAELARMQKDLLALRAVLDREQWNPKSPYDPSKHKRALLSAAGLSEAGRKGLGGTHFDRIAVERLEGGRPFALNYVLDRATSADWGLLDLFYRLVGFQPFKSMFDAAEAGTDEGPVCNLALTSRYLSRFIDTFPSVITAAALEDGRFERGFYHAFLFALFRLGEGEFEDAEDPFPRGRIPFLTIHQSKGLEFPVVVLGSVRTANRNVRRVEEIVHPFVSEGGEPLDRMGDFDVMRMFYVALSRAKNLLVLPHRKGQGQSTDRAFVELLNGPLPRIADLDVASLPTSQVEQTEVVRRYSYTGDYLAYLRCPRQYMLFQRFDFAPSRTQTMFFGSLVHRTIEDLHNHLIASRTPGAAVNVAEPF